MSEPNATFCLLVPDLATLSDEEKDALIVKLWSETVALRLEVEHLRNLNTALERRLSELENKLNQPPKDSSNSSIPPSKDRKKNKEGPPLPLLSAHRQLGPPYFHLCQCRAHTEDCQEQTC